MQQKRILQGLFLADELFEGRFVMVFGVFPLPVADVVVFRFPHFFAKVDVGLLRFLLVQSLSFGKLRFFFIVVVSLVLQYRILHEFTLYERIQLLRIKL